MYTQSPPNAKISTKRKKRGRAFAIFVRPLRGTYGQRGQYLYFPFSTMEKTNASLTLTMLSLVSPVPDAHRTSSMVVNFPVLCVVCLHGRKGSNIIASECICLPL